MKPTYFLLFAALTALVFTKEVRAKASDHHMPLVEVVTTTSDSGRGSLRAAIESANRNAKTRIEFQLPVSDGGFDQTQHSWQIKPRSPLPTLRKPGTIIEGRGVVVVGGDKTQADWSGLRVEASRCHILGMKWHNWPREAISIRASRTVVTNNTFEKTPVAIAVGGAKSRGNRFEKNFFDNVETPIALRDGSNDGIAAPTLTIVRDDVLAPVSHKFTVRFKGKPKSNVVLELDYSSDEVREGVQVQKVHSTHTVKTDAQGNAMWQFDRKGYPVGSWAATATQNGSTSGFSNVVVLPYL